MLWNFAEDTIASIESLTEIASAFNAAVSDASFVEFVSAIPISLNLVANAANSISADSALESKSNATCAEETTCWFDFPLAFSAKPWDISPTGEPARIFSPVVSREIDLLILADVSPNLIAG